MCERVRGSGALGVRVPGAVPAVVSLQSMIRLQSFLHVGAGFQRQLHAVLLRPVENGVLVACRRCSFGGTVAVSKGALATHLLKAFVLCMHSQHDGAISRGSVIVRPDGHVLSRSRPLWTSCRALLARACAGNVGSGGANCAQASRTARPCAQPSRRDSQLLATQPSSWARPSSTGAELGGQHQMVAFCEVSSGRSLGQKRLRVGESRCEQ